MGSFYHINTKRFVANRRIAISVVATFTGLSAIISSIILLLGPSGSTGVSFLFVPIQILMGSILIGMVLCLSVWIWFDRSISRHSRYTYLDLLPGTLLFSRYAGEYKNDYEKIILRRLYVAKVREITDIEINSRTGTVVLKGNIRSYEGVNHRLGYRFHRGNLIFDNWWLNEVQYKSITELSIPDYFNDPVEILKAVKLAKKQAEQMQEIKPYTFKESKIIHRNKIRKRLLPEDLSYKRDWSS